MILLLAACLVNDDLYALRRATMTTEPAPLGSPPVPP
jgi:hypothetical protein